MSIVVCNTAPEPNPVTVTKGAFLYPLPGSVINTFVILPLTTTGVRTACDALATPTNPRSSNVSIFTSYKFETTVGSGSFLFKEVIILSSTIKFSDSTKFVRSINCFRASYLFLNQLCLGLFNAPYFCLGLRYGSGTILSCSSYPLKLSNHLRTISLLG